MPGRWLMVLLVILTGAAAALSADASSDGTADSFEFDPDQNAYVYATRITVAESRPDTDSSIDELPAFVTTIRLDKMATRNLSLPEILSGTAGVNIKDFGGLGKFSTISIRGSGSNQVLVLLDGVRMNSSTDSGVDLSNLSTADIETIEILRGADSAVYGDGAMGGVINLISRKTAGGPPSVSIRTSYGSMASLTSALSAAAAAGGVQWRIQGNYSRSDGDFEFANDQGTPYNPDDDTSDVRKNNDLESMGGSLWWRWAPDDSTAAQLTGRFEQYYAGKGIPGIVTFPSEHARQTDRRISAFTRLDVRLPDPFRLKLEVNGKRTGLDFEDPLGEQTGVPVSTRQRTLTGGGRMAVDAQTRAGVSSLTLELSRDLLSDPSFHDPQRTLWSAALKHDSDLGSDRVWITAMARFDDVSGVGDRWSPKLGARWNLTPRLALKANAGSAFRSPSFNELYMNTGFITGNPDLQPERSWSADTGISWESSRIRGELVLFQQESKDLIQYVLVSGFRYRPLNIGKTRSRGVETSINWTVWRQLAISAAYTYLDAVDRSDDRIYRNKRIPGRPDHELFTRLEWAGQPWGCFAEWRHVSGNYLTRANTKILPDRHTVNAGARITLFNALQLGVELKNLFNNDVVDIRGFPLPPRTVFITAGYTW